MKAGVHFARGSISVFRWVLLCYDIKATCEKIEIGAQHALSDKIIQSFFFSNSSDPIQSDPRWQLQLFRIYYKRTYSFAFFQCFFIVRNYITNAAGDVGVASVQVKNNSCQWPISASNLWQSMRLNLNKILFPELYKAKHCSNKLHLNKCFR